MKKKARVIFGIDDFNPGIMLKNSGEEKLLLSLVKKFPKLKITGFCAAAYSYNKNKYLRFADKKLLSKFGPKIESKKNILSKNRLWAGHFGDLKSLRVEMHGYSHYNPLFGSAEEFRGISGEETYKKMSDSLGEFESAKIRPKVFCPPGWAMNDYVFDFCKKRGIKIAGSFYNQKTKKYSGMVLKNPFRPTKVNGVLCIPRNVDIAFGTVGELEEVIKNNGTIGFHAHVKNIGVSNGITNESIKNLENLLSYLEENYSLNYSFFSDVN